MMVAPSSGQSSHGFAIIFHIGKGLNMLDQLSIHIWFPSASGNGFPFRLPICKLLSRFPVEALFDGCIHFLLISVYIQKWEGGFSATGICSPQNWEVYCYLLYSCLKWN